MPDDNKPLTDEAIDNIVKYIEAAEVMAKSMDLSVSTAARFILKSSQVYARLKGSGVDLANLVSPSKMKS
jgi:hypothetical protein